MIPDSITIAVIWFQIRLLLQSYDSRSDYYCSHMIPDSITIAVMIPGSISVAVIWFQVRLLLQSYDSSLSENIRNYSVSTAQNFSENYSKKERGIWNVKFFRKFCVGTKWMLSNVMSVLSVLRKIFIISEITFNFCNVRSSGNLRLQI